MAVDNRPFKSKEQDGQGNEVIIRDQQLVEQGTATTMASGAYFETRDVDDRPVKIPRDNMMNIVLECIGIILNDSSRNLGTNVQKALGLQGNTVGHSTVADFASVLGAGYLGELKWYENIAANSEVVLGNYQGLVVLQCVSLENKVCIGLVTADQATEIVAANYSCVSGSNKGIKAYINSEGKLAVNSSRGSAVSFRLHLIMP